MHRLQPELHFHEGTLILKHWQDEKAPPCFEQDPRTGQWRSLAIQYPKILKIFEQNRLVFTNCVPLFTKLNIRLKMCYTPYPYQQEAVNAWLNADKRGTVILPTGSGKTFVAIQAITLCKTSTLIVCPTLDLMHQWYDRISDVFDIEVGLLGGGYHEILPVTVTTYDSAYRHMDRYGNYFELLVFDEIHHLPAATYRQIPELSIAPFRLGLTATYRRSDSRHVDLNHLVGPILIEKDIRDMTGEFLANYEIHRLTIPLTEDEKLQYEKSDTAYKQYIRDHQVRFYGEKWKDFIRHTGYNPDARQAMLARREMRHIVFGAEKKLEMLESILKQHVQDRIIIFTQDNALVYRISLTYLIPALTHHTDKEERKHILNEFRAGRYRTIVTSKVLNEGVDVPEANVAVILSGSASTTEHMQRLGRILRKKSDKMAILYEIVTEGTSETNVSYRRRQNNAYR